MKDIACCNAVAEPEYVTHVDAEIRMLDDRLNVLHDVIRTLDTRLAPVLRDIAPAENVKDDNPPQPLVARAVAIRDCRRHIESLTQWLADITGRIEA